MAQSTWNTCYDGAGRISPELQREVGDVGLGKESERFAVGS